MNTSSDYHRLGLVLLEDAVESNASAGLEASTHMQSNNMPV
jgi:hypothetical protein